jgi:hypothetical protein
MRDRSAKIVTNLKAGFLHEIRLFNHLVLCEGCIRWTPGMVMKRRKTDEDLFVEENDRTSADNAVIAAGDA